MTRHTADHADLIALQQALAGFAAFCAELHSGVAADAALVSESWSGEAANRFEELHAMWATGAAQMTNAAETVTGAIAATASTYEAAGESNKQVWS